MRKDMTNTTFYMLSESYEIDANAFCNNRTKRQGKVFGMSYNIGKHTEMILICLIESLDDPKFADIIQKNLNNTLKQLCSQKMTLDNILTGLIQRLYNKNNASNRPNDFNCLLGILCTTDTDQKCTFTMTNNFNIIISTKDSMRLAKNTCKELKIDIGNTEMQQKLVDSKSDIESCSCVESDFLSLDDDSNQVETLSIAGLHVNVVKLTLDKDINFIILANVQLLQVFPWEDLTNYVVSYVENKLSLCGLSTSVISHCLGSEEKANDSADEMICVIRNRKFLHLFR